MTGSSFTNTAAEANDFATNALFVDSTTTPRVEDNLFASNHLPSSCESFCGALVSVSSPALDLNQLSDNTGSGNKSESFGLGGTLIASGSLATLPAGWTPVLTTTFSRQLPPGGLTLAAGVTLTVPAGTVVKAESEAGILVRGGSLVAEGSADSPIVFTSIHDGSAGGATDTNAPHAVGDWTGITVGDADDDSRGGRTRALTRAPFVWRRDPGDQCSMTPVPTKALSRSTTSRSTTPQAWIREMASSPPFRSPKAASVTTPRPLPSPRMR